MNVFKTQLVICIALAQSSLFAQTSPTETPEIASRDSLQSAFDQQETALKRFQAVQADLKSFHQYGLIAFADPQQKITTSLYQDFFDDEEFQSTLNNFQLIAVSTSPRKKAAAQDLAKQVGAKLPDDSAPLLAVTDQNGKLLGQLRAVELAATDKDSVDPEKVHEFLKRYSPPVIDARALMSNARKQARRENKRIFLQQTATWCGPCLTLTRFMNKHRSLWEKDFVWIKIDERWTNAEEVMRPIRKDEIGGIPWIAILDADGKVLATSDNSEGENIGFPAHDEPEGIDHFMKMLKSTAQKMSDEDLKSIKTALEKN